MTTVRAGHEGAREAARLALAALWIVLAPCGARASAPTMTECLEGADFIANAAIARGNGVGRDAFVERLESDMVLIHAFPSELRWFVKDADDERFLHAQVEAVFDDPAAPTEHRNAFLRACFERSGA